MNWLELIAVILGILSVWYARKEKILVFLSELQTCRFTYTFASLPNYLLMQVLILYTLFQISSAGICGQVKVTIRG